MKLKKELNLAIAITIVVALINIFYEPAYAKLNPFFVFPITFLLIFLLLRLVNFIRRP
ncbi:MAG: hypothetical protein RJQ09_04080 [Cyclobacteriaceae bacterium]